MKRWALRIFVVLLLGAIVNVAMAWALARGQAALLCVGPGYVGADDAPLTEMDRIWLREVQWEPTTPARGLSYTLLAVEQSSYGLDVRDVHETVDLASSSPEALTAGQVPTRPAFRLVRAGWPLRSLDGIVSNNVPITNPVDASLLQQWRFEPAGFLVARERFPLDGPVITGWVLPYRPIWPGFAINTVFYTVGLWGLFAVPFVLRRWRRIRRGLCPKCAYDLRGSVAEVCPECGATK